MVGDLKYTPQMGGLVVIEPFIIPYIILDLAAVTPSLLSHNHVEYVLYLRSWSSYNALSMPILKHINKEQICNKINLTILVALWPWLVHQFIENLYNRPLLLSYWCPLT